MRWKKESHKVILFGIKYLVRSFKWITIFSPQKNPNTDIFPEYVKEN